MPYVTDTSPKPDAYLSDVFVNGLQAPGKFIADTVFTPVDIEAGSGKVLKYLPGSLLRDEVKPRPLNGDPERDDISTQDVAYVAEEYGLESRIDRRTLANVPDPAAHEQIVTMQNAQKHRIRRDRLWVQNFFTTSVWTTERAGVSSGPTGTQFLQFDQAGTDPIEFIDGELDALEVATGGHRPNTLTLGADAFRVIKNHSAVIDRIKHTERGVVTEEILASLMGLDEVRVARAVYNSANEGAADSFSYIANTKSMLLTYSDREATIGIPTAGLILRWTGVVPGGAAAGGFIERVQEQGKGYVKVIGTSAWGFTLVSADLGAFYSAAVG